jgi:hypothetical protein
MSSIAIITDTDASLPAEVAARYGIRHCCTTVAAQGGRYLSPFTLGRLHWCECGSRRQGRLGEMTILRVMSRTMKGGTPMIKHTQAKEILEALSVLPPDKVTEVYDFVAFLKERYSQRTAVDVSDAWSEEDLHDLMQASLAHAERTIWTGEEEYG